MPQYDLAALWEAHCRCEFETRDVDATMSTMVAEPYVNHVPTMTGGVGHDELKRFYKYHFIGGNPPDTELIPVSRTVGADQVVDELLFRFTHTSEIDWMLPGVAPTGRKVEIPEEIYSAIGKWRRGNTPKIFLIHPTRGRMPGRLDAMPRFQIPPHPQARGRRIVRKQSSECGLETLFTFFLKNDLQPPPRTLTVGAVPAVSD